MPSAAVSDALKELLRQNRDRIKADYVTERLFVDSAIREKLRRMQVPGVGDDEIVAHLARIEKNKHTRKQKQAHRIRQVRLKRRMKRNRDKLHETIEKFKATL